VKNLRNLLKFNKIDAMLPIYVDGTGNCTEVISADKSYIQTVSIETCIKNLADYYNISLYHNRVNYGDELGITNKVPIVINEDLIYIYINVRKPLLDHDAAFGYIDVNSIEEIFEKDKNAAIKMKSGKEIQTRQSVRSVKKMILNARLAKEIYKEKHRK